MFTGIIEAQGEITHTQSSGSNLSLWLSSPFLSELKIDQSVAHNGICLTITEILKDGYKVVAVEETIKKTTLENWMIGEKINLERCLRVGDRLDGHFVQGHIDGTVQCLEKTTLDGSWLFKFSMAFADAALVIEKGSISINGVALTVFDVEDTSFKVTIIPYTFEHTNFQNLGEGDFVNIEYDVLGKYFLRNIKLGKQN